MSAHPEFDLRTFVDAVAYGVPYPVSANTAAWNESELTHLARAWTGEVPVEEAAAGLAAEMNALLSRERS
ncbi:hypothetical protein ACFQX6_17850 [Streptosporangium lutulentum]